MIDIILSVTRPHEEFSLRLPSDSTVIFSNITFTEKRLTVQFAKPDDHDFIVYLMDNKMEVDSLYFSALSTADNSMNLNSHRATTKIVSGRMTLNAKIVFNMSVPCRLHSTSEVTVEITLRRDPEPRVALAYGAGGALVAPAAGAGGAFVAPAAGAGGALVAPAAGAGGAPVSEDEDEIVDLTDPDVVCLDDLPGSGKRKR